MMERIVVGSDLGPRSRGAVHTAADLAQATGATVHLVCACSTPAMVGATAAVMPMPDHAHHLASARSDAESLADELRRRSIDVEVHTPTGEPAAMLCQVAETVDADLIVVGNKRVQGAARVLGSVAKRVVGHAGCHVMIVRTG